jgi:hypothetical protein
MLGVAVLALADLTSAWPLPALPAFSRTTVVGGSSPGRKRHPIDARETCPVLDSRR